VDEDNLPQESQDETTPPDVSGKEELAVEDIVRGGGGEEETSENNPAEVNEIYVWHSVSPIAMNVRKKHLTKIVNLIEAATLCTDWAIDVRKQFVDKYDAMKQVPPYVMSFYDMTGGHDYEYVEKKATSIPWIQKQMTEDRLLAIKQRISLYDADKISCNPTEGNKKVPNATDPQFLDEMNPKDYYDSVVERTTWSVTSLFMHRGIRVVEEGEEARNKYCLWPLCQPVVNHRPVGVNYIDGFITAMKGEKTLNWENQPGAIIPYCVAKQKDKEKQSIALGFMINSGQSATNDSEYVVESKVNLIAGPVECVGCEETELDKCFFMLTVSSNAVHVLGSIRSFTNRDLIQHYKEPIHGRKDTGWENH
jgi:hypothetical protein